MTEKVTAMSQSGFCRWPGLDDSHRFCKTETCTCSCHTKEDDDEDYD